MYKFIFLLTIRVTTILAFIWYIVLNLYLNDYFVIFWELHNKGYLTEIFDLKKMIIALFVFTFLFWGSLIIWSGINRKDTFKEKINQVLLISFFIFLLFFLFIPYKNLNYTLWKQWLSIEKTYNNCSKEIITEYKKRSIKQHYDSMETIQLMCEDSNGEKVIIKNKIWLNDIYKDRTFKENEKYKIKELYNTLKVVEIEK